MWRSYYFTLSLSHISTRNTCTHYDTYPSSLFYCQFCKFSMTSSTVQVQLQYTRHSQITVIEKFQCTKNPVLSSHYNVVQHQGQLITNTERTTVQLCSNLPVRFTSSSLNWTGWVRKWRSLTCQQSVVFSNIFINAITGPRTISPFPIFYVPWKINHKKQKRKDKTLGICLKETNKPNYRLHEY